jgi:hypothetical protein
MLAAQSLLLVACRAQLASAVQLISQVLLVLVVLQAARLLSRLVPGKELVQAEFLR